MSVNIAIDGPAGAGKSSIAKKVSAEIGFIYVDTGALYRSIAYYKISRKIDNDDELIKNLDKINPSLEFRDGSQHVFINSEDVSDKIRTPEVSAAASHVAAIPEVRKYLFDLQRKIAAENNIIMDGRDIGTAILPNADLKIYLTASSEVRAKRRWLELKEKNKDKKIPSLDEIKADIEKRDYNDMHREVAPLRKAEDAIEIDTSDMSFDEVAEKIKSLCLDI